MENLCSPLPSPPLLPLLPAEEAGWGQPSGWAVLEVECRNLCLALSKEQWPTMTTRRWLMFPCALYFLIGTH